MVKSNLRLAIKMARKHRAPDHVDREDMIQDAMIGLERAVEGFDWHRGYRNQRTREPSYLESSLESPEMSTQHEPDACIRTPTI